jgi:hypothetical protein
MYGVLQHTTERRSKNGVLKHTLHSLHRRESENASSDFRHRQAFRRISLHRKVLNRLAIATSGMTIEIRP